MAVERVLEGEVASAVITSYGFNRTTIYKWLTAAAKPGVGLRALQARPRSRLKRAEYLERRARSWSIESRADRGRNPPRSPAARGCHPFPSGQRSRNTKSPG